MSTCRPVVILHRPLNYIQAISSLSALSQPGHQGHHGHQAINHMVVEVGREGHTFRYELRVQEDKKTVYLMVTHNEPRGTFRVAQGIGFIDSDIEGLTSYSNERIQEIANQLIENHGEYDLMLNSCQGWAMALFDEIANIKGRSAARVGSFVNAAAKEISSSWGISRFLGNFVNSIGAEPY
ncbi:hypothetical protein K432DRAFT_136299 [Lepidopterella palustris CBS 459.81]|uniref:PPPDE domain-containing protein n=1 Tax=Lepidopterella palustris CBS 459.81 TaxID=1314670 RepID=A0A8E2JC99_9PEZI|nr:hypothetical protein K432DRAFT_136299 [Lepidopterella palustris CBS 459.81]